MSPAGKARRAKAIEDTAATLKKPEDQAAERHRLQTIDQRRERDLEAAAKPKAGSPEAHTTERLTQLEARLAVLSPEQRRQPAWYRRHPEGVRRLDYGDIVDAGTSGRAAAGRAQSRFLRPVAAEDGHAACDYPSR